MRRFTPAEIAKLRLMAGFGHSGISVARALDRTPQAIRVKACELGVRLRPSSVEHRRLKVSRPTWLRLQAEAVALGMSPGRLARLLLEMAVRDNLVAAIIDMPPATRRTRPR